MAIDLNTTLPSSSQVINEEEQVHDIGLNSSNEKF